MGDDYEISEMKSEWAATSVYSISEAQAAFEDMEQHFPYVGMARIMPEGHEWYVMGSKTPLQLRVHPGPVEEPSIGQLEAAIEYLADKHSLYLWRVDENTGVAGEGEHVKGWAFARHNRREDVQGATVSDAVIFNLEKIQKANREQQIKTQRELEQTMRVASDCESFLEAIAGPQEPEEEFALEA